MLSSIFSNIPEKFRFLTGKKITVGSLTSMVHPPVSDSFKPLSDVLLAYGITECNLADKTAILESLSQIGLKRDNYVICLSPDWVIQDS